MHVAYEKLLYREIYLFFKVKNLENVFVCMVVLKKIIIVEIVVFRYWLILIVSRNIISDLRYLKL